MATMWMRLLVFVMCFVSFEGYAQGDLDRESTEISNNLYGRFGVPFRQKAAKVEPAFYPTSGWFPDDFVVRTGPDCEGCIKDLPLRLTQAIGAAENSVDIMTLSSIDDKFLKAIAKGIVDLDAKRRSNSVVVRILLGQDVNQFGYKLVSGSGGKCSPVSVVGEVAPWGQEPSDAADGVSKVCEGPKDKYLIAKMKNVRQKLLREIGFLPKTVSIHVGMFSGGGSGWGFSDWSHAKIFAVDADFALVGGMNLWDDYLDSQPVFDLSVVVRGGAARSAQRFAVQYWKYVCGAADQSVPGEARDADVKVRSDRGEGAGLSNAVLVETSIGTSLSVCDDTREVEPSRSATLARPATKKPVRIFGVGRYGSDSLGNEPSDIAILHLITNARKEILLSQQALFYPTGGTRVMSAGWDRFLDALIDAIGRGVVVKIVVSSSSSEKDADGKTEYSGYSSAPSADVYWALLQRFLARKGFWYARYPRLDCQRDLEADFAAHVQIANVAMLKEGWLKPSGFWDADRKVRVKNHAKVILVDGRKAYIGSQNLYPPRVLGVEAGLAEFGYVVYDTDVVARIISLYWDPLWSGSSLIRAVRPLCNK